MPFMYNGGILELIYVYVSPEAAARDIRLTFEALRLLGSLMCHRCVYLEFVEEEGLRAVLKVPRPSVAATAVSVVLYYTAYFEDAMERVSIVMFVMKPVTTFCVLSVIILDFYYLRH